MKRLLFTFVALALMTTAMAQDNSQERRGPRMSRTEMIEKRTNSMVEKYQLTADQAAKVKELNEKYMGQMGPRRNGNGQRPRPQADGQQPQADGQTGATAQNKPETNLGERQHHKNGGQRRGGFSRFNRSKYNEELKGIMTESQYKAYEADMQKRMEKRPTAKIQ